jgi:septum formation protein
MQIVLGSKSARRKELLELMGYEFSIDGADTDETVQDYRNPEEYVKKIALKKSEVISKRHPDKLVICADTVVSTKSEILGKPVSAEDARRMIRLISGGCHYVLTAVVLDYCGRKVSFVEKTAVVIDKLTEEEIEEYVASDEPYDKAGAYAIQGRFAKHISKIKGDYYNVMGLPINRLYHEIRNIEKEEKNQIQ